MFQPSLATALESFRRARARARAAVYPAPTVGHCWALIPCAAACLCAATNDVSKIAWRVAVLQPSVSACMGLTLHSRLATEQLFDVGSTECPSSDTVKF